jgi:hypothetical protein
VWTTTQPQPVPTVSIYVSRDNGTTYTPLAIDTPNDGSYVWTVDPPGTNSGSVPQFTALIKIVAKDVSNVTGEDTSDDPFSIYDLVTATVVTRLDAMAGDDGITVKWALQSRGMFAEVELERSDAETGPWAVVAAAAQQQGELTIATDRTATAGHTYWYRLVGTTSLGATAVFGPVQAAMTAPKEFALSSTWPNPTPGPLHADFSLPHAAKVHLSLLDIQGREVVVLADGEYAAGRYRMQWDGVSGRGRVTAGLYFLRYQVAGKTFGQRVAITN